MLRPDRRFGGRCARVFGCRVCSGPLATLRRQRLKSTRTSSTRPETILTTLVRLARQVFCNDPTAIRPDSLLLSDDYAAGAGKISFRTRPQRGLAARVGDVV